MITTLLAIFTVQAALGQEPPQILKAYNTYAECQRDRQKLLHEKWKEMHEKLVFPACMRIVVEDARTNESSDEITKADGSPKEIM